MVICWLPNPQILWSVSHCITIADTEQAMFSASSSSSATPTMTLDGRSVTVDERGFGQIEFTATPASQYDDRECIEYIKQELQNNI